MKNKLLWFLRICLFLSLIPVGRSFGRRFYQGDTQGTTASQNTLLIVTRQFGFKSAAQSIWIVERGANNATLLVQVYPNMAEISGARQYAPSLQLQSSNKELERHFDLNGFFDWWQVKPAFFDFLHKQGISWDHYFVIDQNMTDEIARLTGVDPMVQLLNDSRMVSPQEYQAKLWLTICAQAVQLPGGLDLNNIKNSAGHLITNAPAAERLLFAPSPSIANCGSQTALALP